MTDTNDPQPGAARVHALHELRAGLRPSRDLWPQIESRITAIPAQLEPRIVRRRLPLGWASAAAVLLIAVGVWIGRHDRAPSPGGVASLSLPSSQALADACLADARYLRDRGGLASGPTDTLAGLPPESRERVLASLGTIHDAIHDIETELSRDSANPLLQDLLLHTCQDETRVLTEVHDAGGSTHAERGI